MLKQVAADVRRETRNGQKPQQLSDMTKAFYFAKADQIPAPTPHRQLSMCSESRALRRGYAARHGVLERRPLVE